jgi:uncharacterized protein
MGSTPVMGRISQFWRYPVKSMLGERRQSLTVEQRGVQGDRLYAVRDADGKFGSGKNTRRFRKSMDFSVFQLGIAINCWRFISRAASS